MSFASAAKTSKGSESPAPAPAAREAGRGVTPPLLVAAGGVAQCADACFEPRLAPLPPGAQAKLVVGAVDDPLEHEADTFAERLLRMPDKGAPAALPVPGAVEGPRLRRKCTTCAMDEERIQRKADGGASGGGLTPASHVRAATASGLPLPASARAYFEPRLGRDLSNVRVHTGPAAAASARAVGARAYTLGSDIVFARGHFSPETQEGRRLLAHELAHTLQQGCASGVLRRQPDGGAASDAGANPAPQTAAPGPAPTVVPGATVPPPPPTPKGPTTVYNGVTLADDEAFLRHQMEQYIADNGP
ncbi:MAG TPA: DUF4157 domain-containing protein, partial [Myxococcus sp.]|nr:DUF4157 domain-containing protein [Myxococcus sp.]